MSTNTSNFDNAANASVAAANGLNGLRTLEEALTGVNSALAREGEELNERDLAQLLRELEAADSVADGVETKLDELLKNLEGMLDGLESADGQANKPEASPNQREDS
ncbi:hypothetical protein FRC07_011826 [Ceratobasidium sp. 392]|nr:hypothetical protein FRC07_011826 [Ceratobasidium sp. 392]